MAFVGSFLPVSGYGTRGLRTRTCRVRMQTEGGADENPGTPVPRPVPKVTNDSANPRRKLVRNVSDTKNAGYAQAAPGDMVGAPKVGEGMGPRRGVQEKKVTKAAAIQKSQGFADAWAEQNQGRPDVWLFIGLIFLLTPLLVLAWGVWSGIIPLGAAFE